MVQVDVTCPGYAKGCLYTVGTVCKPFFVCSRVQCPYVHQIKVLVLCGCQHPRRNFCFHHLMLISHTSTSLALSLHNTESLPVMFSKVGYTCWGILVYSSMQNILSFFLFLSLCMWTSLFNSEHMFSVGFKSGDSHL